MANTVYSNEKVGGCLRRRSVCPPPLPPRDRRGGCRAVWTRCCQRGLYVQSSSRRIFKTACPISNPPSRRGGCWGDCRLTLLSSFIRRTLRMSGPMPAPPSGQIWQGRPSSWRCCLEEFAAPVHAAWKAPFFSDNADSHNHTAVRVSVC